MAIFQQYPHPNTDSVGDGLNYRGFTFSSPLPQKLDAYVAKCKSHYWGVSEQTQFIHWLIDREYRQCREAA